MNDKLFKYVVSPAFAVLFALFMGIAAYAWNAQAQTIADLQRTTKEHTAQIARLEALMQVQVEINRKMERHLERLASEHLR